VYVDAVLRVNVHLVDYISLRYGLPVEFAYDRYVPELVILGQDFYGLFQFMH
jgi:hypothetical protein